MTALSYRGNRVCTELASIGVGDQVVTCGTGWSRVEDVECVTRLTRERIVIGRAQYSHKTGRGHGVERRIVIDPDHAARIIDTVRRDNARAAIERAARTLADACRRREVPTEAVERAASDLIQIAAKVKP